MPPTVPVGTQRVRVCLHAGNKERDVERLVRVVGEWLVLQGKVEGEREENVGNVGREVKDERVREVFVKAVL